MIKNTAAIDKIIAQLAMKDYLRYNPRNKDGRPKYKKYRPYTLSPETNEAREIQHKYLKDEISENEYKAYCLRWNILHQEGA